MDRVAPSLDVPAAIELLRSEMSVYVNLETYAAQLNALTDGLVEMRLARRTTQQILRDQGLSDQQVRRVSREVFGDIDLALRRLKAAL